MAAYAEFARFYDQIMGDRGPEISRIRDYITRYQPGATTLLELGCGTGAILSGLAGRDDSAGPGLAVTGVDLSPQMLAIARASLPGARLVEADITSFALGTRFDVVICVFDTLNHVPAFESWLRLFDRVDKHLADGGLFIFDVNTTGRLRRLWHGAGFATDFGPNTVVMDITPGGGDLSRWEVRIFEQVSGNDYRLHREVIPELAVPLADIRAALAGRFDLMAEDDLDDGPVSDESSRVFFAYRRR